MRKPVKILPIAVAVAFLCFLAVCAVSCNNDKKTSVFDGRISETRTNVYKGESEHFEVIACCGSVETPFVRDGNVGEMRDYFALTVYPKFEITQGNAVTLRYKLKGEDVEKQLPLSPDGLGFSCDLPLTLKNVGFEGFSVNVTALQFDEDIPCLSLLSDKDMSFDEAKKLGMNRLEECVAKTKNENGEYGFEMRIKLIDKRAADQALYWLVAVDCKNGENYSVMFETKQRIETVKSKA